MKKLILWVVGIIAFLWVVGKCNESKEIKIDKIEADSTVLKTINKEVASKATGNVEIPSSSNWTYSEDEDKLTSKKTYYASTEATELLNFDFPYDGGTTATLYVRTKSGLTDVFVKFSKAQLIIDSYDGSNFRVRFDKKPASTYMFTGASDHSSDITFLQNSTRFIKNLKASKKVIIELEFYKEGFRAIEFNVEGFKWNY